MKKLLAHVEIGPSGLPRNENLFVHADVEQKRAVLVPLANFERAFPGFKQREDVLDALVESGDARRVINGRKAGEVTVFVVELIRSG